MAKLDFRGLIPGKRYKIVIHPETVYGTLKALPTIDFVVPEAPPRARNFRLDIRTRFKTAIIGYANRKLRIYKYKVILDGTTNKKYAVIITGTGVFKKNRIKPGDKVNVSISSTFLAANPGATNISISNAVVVNSANTPKNRIKYEIPSGSTHGWYTYTTDDSSSSSSMPITHVGGGAAILKKIPTVRLRIPKAIHQNLMWNDTVRDFVHIVYRTGKSKATVHGKRKYLIGDTEIDRNTPIQDGSGGFDIDDATYPNGHPPVFTKEIKDAKYYQFEFIIARYVRYKNADGSYTSWTGSWIEKEGPFNNKLSRPAGWKA